MTLNSKSCFFVCLFVFFVLFFLFLFGKRKKKAKKIKINLQIIFVNKLHDSIWLSVSNILSDFFVVVVKNS